MSTIVRLTLALLIIAAPACADVKPAAIFADHMVVQRDIKVPVWGFADPGEKVTVTAAGQERSVLADAAGSWRVVLDPIASRQPIEIVVAGKNSIAIKDVLVGEVWLCSGQSNMAFRLASAKNGAEAVKNADRPTMRLFNMARAYNDQPQKDVTGKWELCTPKSAEAFSAVAYFFGTELQKEIDVPVGLIEADWGGTRAEAWIPRDEFDALKLPYEPQWTAEWLHPKPNPASTQPAKERPYEAPATIYNGMIAPIAGFAMRGVAWYQGETNTAYPVEYQRVLESLIASWRNHWGQGGFPFLIVQLPNFKGPTRDWVALRKSQAEVAKGVPNVGMIVTIDLGNPNNIHPTDKLPVGQRLAALAEKMAYQRDVPFCGPELNAVHVRGNEAVVGFKYVFDGLVAKGELQGFEIAGADRKFVAANGRIEGETVIVSAEGVSQPVAVRYGWSNDPKCTLYNGAGFPAAPFEWQTSK